MGDLIRSGKRFNIVLSILIAVLLWFYVVNVENPVGETNIPAVPVIIQGADILEEKGLMVTKLSRDTVNLKAVGKRKTFLKLYNSNMALTLDVSGIDEVGEHKIIGKVAPEFLRADTSVTITERDNFFISVTVKKKESREIPVMGEFHGSLASGYDADDIKVTPGTIQVSGPADVMEHLSHAVVVLTGENINQTIRQVASFVILDQSGNVVEQESLICQTKTIEAELPVVKLHEIPLTIQLNGGGGAAASDAQVTITPAVVQMSGPEELLAGIKEISLGEIDLAEIFTNKSKTYQIAIPEGLTCHSKETEAIVSINIELPMKSITSDNISIINVPKGYRAALVTDALQVWVRGSQTLLDQVSGANLRIEVDLKGTKPKRGQQRVEANVYLDGVSGVGVVGTDYSVAISIK